VDLKRMLSDLNNDQKAEDEENRATMCKCTNDVKDYSASISTHDSTIKELDANIVELQSVIGKLDKDITSFSQTVADMAEAVNNTSGDLLALEAAHLARITENNESIDILGRTIEALTDASANNTEDDILLQHAADLIQDQLRNHPSMLRGALSLEQQHTASGLSMLRGSPSTAYSEILGILGQLKVSFVSDNEDAIVQYSKKTEVLDALLKSYEAQKAAAESNLATSTAEHGDVKAPALELALSTRDSENTHFETATANLNVTKVSCNEEREQYDTITKIRQDEAAAVALAISILDDKAFRTQTTHTSFVQVGAQEDVPPFLRLHNAIEKLLADLANDLEDAKTQLDQCNEKLKIPRDALAEISTKVSDLEGTTQDFQGRVSDMRSLIDTNIEDVKKAQEDLKKKGEERATQNVLFQVELAHATEQQIKLNLAIDALQRFPEQATKENAKQLAITTLGDVLSDAQDMAKTLISDEGDNQRDYAEAVKTMTVAAADADTEIHGFEKEFVDMEIRLSEDMNSLTSSSKTKILVSKELSDLNASCDLIIRNFNSTRDAINSETSGLVETARILGNFSSENASAA